MAVKEQRNGAEEDFAKCRPNESTHALSSIDYVISTFRTVGNLDDLNNFMQNFHPIMEFVASQMKNVMHSFAKPKLTSVSLSIELVNVIANDCEIAYEYGYAHNNGAR